MLGVAEGLWLARRDLAPGRTEGRGARRRAGELGRPRAAFVGQEFLRPAAVGRQLVAAVGHAAGVARAAGDRARPTTPGLVLRRQATQAMGPGIARRRRGRRQRLYGPGRRSDRSGRGWRFRVAGQHHGLTDVQHVGIADARIGREQRRHRRAVGRGDARQRVAGAHVHAVGAGRQCERLAGVDHVRIMDLRVGREQPATSVPKRWAIADRVSPRSITCWRAPAPESPRQASSPEVVGVRDWIVLMAAPMRGRALQRRSSRRRPHPGRTLGCVTACTFCAGRCHET